MSFNAREHELHVAARREVAEGVVALDLVSAQGLDLPAWSPGAHIDLVLRPGFVRQYSLCGLPSETEVWRIAILLEPAGRGGSAYVHSELSPGATVTARGPRNHFELQPATRYQFIAGGIGITPLLPMVETAQQQNIPWNLVYGGRTAASMAFIEELQRYDDKVRLCPQDEQGLLDLADILAGATDTTRTYCCGPESLLRAVEAAHGYLGRGCLHVERFVPKIIDDPAPSSDFELVLSQSGLSLRVPADRSIIKVLEAAGVEVPFSCEEGTCGTCETRVDEGIPDHRDSILSPAEKQANKTIMICVSRSRSPRLVLDL